MTHPPDRFSGGSFSFRAGIHTEPAVKRGADFFRIEEGAPADAVDREIAPGLPFTEGPETGAGGFVRKDDGDAGFCSDEYFGCGHGQQDATPFRPSKMTPEWAFVVTLAALLSEALPDQVLPWHGSQLA